MTKQKPEIKMMKLNEIKPYENNPRQNDKAVEYVANSIKDFGFKVPIVVDKDMVIINGHTRFKASQKLGLKEVPVIVADDLSEDKVRAFRLADNKSSEIATWDYELLEDELGLIELDMADYGFVSLEDEAQSLIDDLMENEFAVHNTSSQEFSVTFVFNKQYEQQIKQYISKHGKEDIVANILKFTEEI
jgi:hypothetical protein